jgi:hypothetical protein
MSTSEGRAGERAKDVRFTEDTLVVDLLERSAPTGAWPGGGFGIHWPDVDEDLSTEGLLRGAPARRGSAAAGRTIG